VQVSPETLGDKNVDNWFAAVRFDPNDSFSTVYKFDYSTNHGTPEGTGFIGIDPRGVGPLGPVLSALIASNPVVVSGAQRPDAVNNWWATGSYERVWGHNVTSTWRINDHLTLKNILAYRNSFVYANAQIDGAGGIVVTPQAVAAMQQLAPGVPVSLIEQALGLFPGQPVSLSSTSSQSSSEQFSDEIQVNYESKYLTLTTGALYFHLNTVAGAPFGLPNTPIITSIPNFNLSSPNLTSFNSTAFNYATSKAVYAQAELHVTPKLDLVGGYRLTDDDKNGTVYLQAGTPAETPVSFTYANARPTYTGIINYRPIDGILLYSKYSTGFVSGGAVSTVAFEPETARSWEFGFKGDLLDRRVRTNLALFDVTYKNVQSAQGGVNVGHPELGTVVVNSADEKARGFEAEVTALPIRGLTLNAGLGYTDLYFTSVNPLLGTIDSYKPTLVPKWTTNLSANYVSQPVWQEANMMFELDANWRSNERTYTLAPSPVFDPILFSPASWVLNGRVALQHIRLKRGEIELALWGKNINDNKAIQFPLAFGAPGTIPFVGSTTYQPARTFGFDILYNY
jgi:iron complex outermembrane receptor protein